MEAYILPFRRSSLLPPGAGRRLGRGPDVRLVSMFVGLVGQSNDLSTPRTHNLAHQGTVSIPHQAWEMSQDWRLQQMCSMHAGRFVFHILLFSICNIVLCVWCNGND